MTKKSVFGLNENVAAALSYLLGFFSGIVILVMEKENNFVRFHALQSTLWFMVLSIVMGIAVRLPIIGGLADSISWLVFVVPGAFLMFNAFMGRKFKIPMIGAAAEAQIDR